MNSFSYLTDQQLRYVWLILLWTQCETAPVSDILVVSVQPPDLVRPGLSATLPCWLNPPQNAEDLEVRWYRDNYDTPVLLYKAKAFDDTQQDASYAGRVLFGLKDATSGGLKTGDVSLKLVNTTIQDAGQYTCYVTSLQGYDSSPVTLVVTETGRSSVLSAVRTEDNMVNVSCESEGWYPQPVLRWSDQHKELNHKSLLFNKDSSGLVSVHSWLLVPSSSKVSCSVVLPNKDTREATLLLDFPPQPAGTAGWVAFAIVLVAALALAALVMYYKKKVKTFKPSRDERDAAGEPLLPKALANNNYVNVKLEDTDTPFLKIRNNKLRDTTYENVPEGPRVTCLTAVKGSPGFTSGQHYWEVSLRVRNDIHAKQSWWLGVTAAREIPNDYNFTPNTSNGFWFLSSSPDRADSFQVSTEPKVFFAFTERPSKVGVYLDYDKGEISFYNVEEESLIGSLAATFTGEVFPLFNPGRDDISSMEILHREEQNQSSNDAGSPEKTSDGTGQNQSSNNAEPPEKTSDGTGQNQCSENVGCGGETAEAFWTAIASYLPAIKTRRVLPSEEHDNMYQQLRYVWLILLWTQCETAPVSDILVVSVQPPELVRPGLSATLPCWLNPPQNAEDLEVRWYRDNYDTPVLLYKAKAFDDTQQDASYAGRVSFGLKDATSGGLKTGDVSLKLVNTTIQDAGQYTCYVTSLQGYDSSPVTLEVTETGRSSVLSAVRTEDNMVNVSCESEGWYPQPVLRWSNQYEELNPKSLLFNKDSSGLVSVHSWLLVPSSSKVSCSVVLPNKDTKEATLLLDFPPQPVGTAGWVAFAIVLVAALALAALGVMYYKKKVEKSKQSRDERDGKIVYI
ncbi:butyrophilin subfamily 2 member A2-like [Mugil cephalus]|uniref:butyrophilin subfamily 2 member A2-like n=1 Tax=Mugil cephalus TaxID=48193 RepID=UPI001FB828E8|nr:butyrophilin subfamily 2 member A2-like [Mugil cephalus]